MAMMVDSSGILAAVAIGVGATLFMDLWNFFLKRAFGIPSLDYCMLGRWIAHMPAGTLRHSNIRLAGERPFECGLGWLAHYSIGVVFAIGFATIAGMHWLSRPTLLPALLFGIATVVFPFFIMQPSLGFGVAGSRTPNPAQARLKSLATHTIFGLGLYLAASAVSPMLLRIVR